MMTSLVSSKNIQNEYKNTMHVERIKINTSNLFPFISKANQHSKNTKTRRPSPSFQEIKLIQLPAAINQTTWPTWPSIIPLLSSALTPGQNSSHLLPFLL